MSTPLDPANISFLSRPLLFGHVEIIIKAILQRHFVEVFAHLLTPFVLDSFAEARQLTSLGQLWHELVAVLPLI